MVEALERLVFECFVQEERRLVELRLSKEEVDYLCQKYGAICTLQPGFPSNDGKMWYMVEIDL